MSGQIRHMGMDVRGALRWPKRALRGLLKEDDGRVLTPDEARAWLMDQLAAGWDIVPCCPCDNFDRKRGCQGHADPDAVSEPVPPPARRLAYFDRISPWGAPHRVAYMVEESRDKPQPDHEDTMADTVPHLSRLTTALENWGRHFDWCGWVQVPSTRWCNCGLATEIEYARSLRPDTETERNEARALVAGYQQLGGGDLPELLGEIDRVTVDCVADQQFPHEIYVLLRRAAKVIRMWQRQNGNCDCGAKPDRPHTHGGPSQEAKP